MPGETNPSTKLTKDIVLETIRKGDFTGSNTWGRGIEGDLEEILGWHEDNLANSPLSQQDRIGILSTVQGLTESVSHKQGQELHSFATKKIRELKLDEATRYLKARATSEQPEIKSLADAIVASEARAQEMYNAYFRLGRPGGINLDRDSFDNVYHDILEGINQNKLKLYELLWR